MRQDQRWNNYQYKRPHKEKMSVWRQLRTEDKRGNPIPLRGNITTTRWAGEKTTMVRVARGTRYYADAEATKQQLNLSGTTDANIRGYTITIPVEKTKNYQRWLDSRNALPGDPDYGMRQPTKPLVCRYYSVYARKVRQIGPKIPRM